MTINKGLENQIATETVLQMVKGDIERVEATYKRYLDYTRQYPGQFDKRKQSFVVNCYAVFKKLELKNGGQS